MMWIDDAMQLAGALLVLLFLIHFQRRYRRRYLREWLFAWSAAAVVSSAFLLLRLTEATIGRGLRTSLLTITVVATGLQLFWLLLSSRGLCGRANLSTTSQRRWLSLIALFSVAGAITVVMRADSATLVREIGMARGLIVGAVNVVCGAIVLRERRRADDGPVLIFGGSLLVYGVARAALSLSIGVLGSTTAAWSAVDLFLQGIIALAMVVTLLEDERESAIAAVGEVEQRAYHDALTGLPNRALLFDRIKIALAHAQRHRHRTAVLFLDLDRFKTINDSLGHSVGDELLKIAAERIRGCLRNEDTLSRFGGDEFVILMPIVARMEDPARVAQKILEAMDSPVTIGGHEMIVTSSIGIAVHPNDGADAETIVKNADAAMYQAKEEGRERFRFYAPAMNERTLEMLELETALRRALQHEELALHYQPLIDVATGSIYGLEALLRWAHPRLGILTPDRFIQTAESTGLIVPIGNWVLHRACQQARAWQRQLSLDLIVSVNLSAKQLLQHDLVDQVRAALSESGLRPRHLELEITETTAMTDVDRTIALLRELKALGVRVSIDDFGTGYSSLSYLKQLPVDTLKLDQAFVREITLPEDGAIAKGVIAMAHSLDLKVVAEGVETLGQLEFLRTHSCDRLQGFLFSRPLEPSIFEKFFQKNGKMIRVA